MLKEDPPSIIPDNGIAISQLANIIQELTSNLNERNREIASLMERVGRAEATADALKEELTKKTKHAGDVDCENPALAV